jgi:hypothetical protein
LIARLSYLAGTGRERLTERAAQLAREQTNI